MGYLSLPMMQLKCLYMMKKLWSGGQFSIFEYVVRGCSMEMLMHTLISQYCVISFGKLIVELKTTKYTTCSRRSQTTHSCYRAKLDKI